MAEHPAPYARVAQWLEHYSYKVGVGGSIPPTRTRKWAGRFWFESRRSHIWAVGAVVSALP